MLNAIVAFEAEAQPFVECFSLEVEKGVAHRSHVGQGIVVAVGGMGFERARFTTRELMASCEDPGAVWLNFGIAGSGGHDIGELVLARSVHYKPTGQLWELENWAGLALAAAPLETADHAREDYGDGTVFDMEAAGMLSALGDATGRAICLKLISDGPDHPLDQFDIRAAAGLLRDSKDRLKDVINTIRRAAQTVR